MASDPLVGAKSKIKRANEHIEEVHTHIVSFLRTEPYPYTITVDRDSVEGRALMKAQFTGDIPAKIAVVIGDVFQNLRSSLDYLACALATKNGATKISDVYFPFAINKQEFEAEGTQRKIKKLSPDAIAMIHALQPYKGGNDLLWALGRIAVVDKHQNLVPIGAAGIGGKVNLLMSPGTTETLTFKVPQNWKPLDKEVVLLDFPSVIKDFSGDIQLTVDIAFSNVEVFEGQPVMTVLNYFSNLTQRVVLAFENRFFNS